jgi:hypothetical protein
MLLLGLNTMKMVGVIGTPPAGQRKIKDVLTLNVLVTLLVFSRGGPLTTLLPSQQACHL